MHSIELVPPMDIIPPVPDTVLFTPNYLLGKGQHNKMVHISKMKKTVLQNIIIQLTGVKSITMEYKPILHDGHYFSQV